MNIVTFHFIGVENEAMESLYIPNPPVPAVATAVHIASYGFIPIIQRDTN